MRVLQDETTGNYYIADRFNTRTAYPPVYIRTIDTDCLLVDTFSQIPEHQSIPDDTYANADVLGFEKMKHGGFILFHIESELTIDRNHQILTRVDENGATVWQSNLIAELENPFFSDMRTNGNTVLTFSYDTENYILTNGADGTIVWHRKIHQWKGKPIRIFDLTASTVDDGYIGYFREVENYDQAYLLHIAPDGTLTQIGEFKNKTDRFRTGCYGLTALENGDLLIDFFSGPDTMIRNERVWEWVIFRHIALVKAEDLDYITPVKEEGEIPVDWFVFPNPASVGWTIQLPDRNSRIILYDATGVVKYNSTAAGGATHYIPNTDFSAGIYLLQLTDAQTGKSLGTRKLILQP